MCGAFSIRLNPWERAEIHNSSVPIKWQPIYNARPGEWLPIITEEQPQKITTAFWGYLPRWMDPKRGQAVINARAETLRTRPYFRDTFLSQRCIIPADGFYEWEKKGTTKVPYYFHRKDDKPFAFAGLYDFVPNDKDKVGFAIITTLPNAVVSRVHDRMPVMLQDNQVRDWLNPDIEAEQAAQLMIPYPDDLMASFEVSQAVNSAKNKGPEAIEPASSELGRIQL